VKLWQFDLADRTQIRLDSNQMAFTPDRDGVDTMPLFADDNEAVSLERWTANAEVTIDAPDGIEILVLEGGFDEAGEDFKAESWLRLPKGSQTTAQVGANGARVWVKRNHLATPPTAPSA